MSLFAFLQGWAASQALSFAYFALRGAPNRAGDELALSWLETSFAFGLMALVFGGIAWTLVMFPIALAVRADSLVCRASIAPFLGALIAVIALRIEYLLGLRTYFGSGMPWFYFACAACLGAVGWSSNAWMLRNSHAA